MLKVSARIFPIGYIISVDNPDFDPHDFYIDGVWEQIKGRVVVGVDENQTEFNVTGKTGGAKTHTLTIAEMPSHWHGVPYAGPTQGTKRDRYTLNGYSDQWADAVGTSSVGSGTAHNNLQPYYVAYMWKLVSYSN